MAYDLFYPARRLWLQGWLATCGAAFLLPARATQRPTPADEETLRLTTELVLVNVTVLDSSGRYVHGLQLADFMVFQGGVAQKIEHFSAGDAPFCAAVMIDTSDSMRTKLRSAQRAAAHFQSLIQPDDAVAIYAFSSTVEQIQAFSAIRTVTPQVWSLRARGKTRLYDGLQAVIMALDARPERRRAIVLISDGADTASNVQPDTVMRQAAQADVLVYAVDLYDARFPSQEPEAARHGAWLMAMATATGGCYIKSPGGTDLTARFAEVVEELRAQYTLGFYPPNGHDGQTHGIRVRVRRPNVTWRARKSYA